MADLNLSGTTEISDTGIKKHFKNFEPWQALFELAWNGLDARARNISIEIIENDMHGVQSIAVLDNGDGIDIEHIKDNFGKFNDSSKKEDMAQHGLHGRGRLAFHKLAHDAKWWTRCAAGIASIEVHSAKIRDYKGKEVSAESLPAVLAPLVTGTCVELSGLHSNLPPKAELLKKFSVEFGWYLALNEDRSITINGTPVVVPPHQISKRTINSGNVNFDVKVLCWEDRPSSEKSHIYLLDSEGKTRHKSLSSFNLKKDFFASVYVTSAWADNFVSDGANLFAPDAHSAESEEWKKLARPLNDFIQEVYDDFLRKFVDAELTKYEEDGIFPSYAGLDPTYANWRASNTKNLVRLVYTSDPSVMNSLNKKQKKIIVRLLDRISVSNENDALFDILNDVLDLDGASLSQLSKQLQHTRLEHIISTIEILQQRQAAVNKLRELMNEHYHQVRETPDLQQIIENNTWLFGNRYETIGAEEDTFTKIAKNLRDQIKSVHQIDTDDVEDGVFAKMFGIGYVEPFEDDKRVVKRLTRGVDHKACKPGWGREVNANRASLDFPGTDHQVRFYERLPLSNGKYVEYSSGLVSMPYKGSFRIPQLPAAQELAEQVGWQYAELEDWSWYSAQATTLILYRRTTTHEEMLRMWSTSFKRWLIENKSRLKKGASLDRRQVIDDAIHCQHLPLDAQTWDDMRERCFKEFAPSMYHFEDQPMALAFKKLFDKWLSERGAQEPLIALA